MLLDGNYRAVFCVYAPVMCDWMSDCSFTQHTLNIYQSGYSTVWYIWLVPSETGANSTHFLCTTYNHAKVHSVTFKATCIRRMRVFSCNLPPTLMAEWPGSVMCYCGNTNRGGMDTEITAQKVDPGEENSDAPAGTWIRDLSITSPSLYQYHWAILAPLNLFL